MKICSKQDLSCDKCDFKTKSESRLVIHRRKHNKNHKLKKKVNKRSEKSRKCSENVSDERAMRQKKPNNDFDQYVVVGPKPNQTNKCIHCEYTSKYSSNIMKHFERKHGAREKIPCHICGKRYRELDTHIRDKHSSPEGKTKCVKCLVDVDNEEFSKHICLKLPCPSCNQLFLNHVTLKNHIKNTHEYHPDSYYCSECGKGFPTQSKLSTHMKIHQESSPCPECGAVVKNLRTHMIHKHHTEEDKKFICQDCDKRFLYSSKLDKHRMSVHLKLRPYKCRYGCEFAYNDICNRSAHERKTHGKLFTTAVEEKERYRESLKVQAEKL